MTGSIIKRGKGTYLLRLSLGRDEQTGKRLYRTATFHGTKKEAEQALRDMVNRYEAGGMVSADRVSLNAYLQEWLKVAKKNSVGERTFHNYSAHIERYVAKTIGRLPLSKVSVADVQGLYGSMVDQGLGTPTIKLVHTILNQAFKQAVRWRKMNYNPAADTERPREKRKKVIRAMTKPQASAFLKAAEITDDSALFHVALISGMRPGEYLGLTWDCVDWGEDRVRVEKSLVTTPGKARFLGPPKTPESRRSISLPSNVMAQLKDHLAQQQQLRAVEGEQWHDLDLVFPNTVGNFRDLRNLSTRVFKRLLEVAKLPQEFRLYDLRHTCATLLLQADENVKVVSERLGHATVKLTLDTYSHVLPTMQKRASDKLGDMFFPDP
jgi:integrase